MRIRFHQSLLGIGPLLWMAGVVCLSVFTLPQLFHSAKLSLFGTATVGTVTHVEWKRVSSKRSVPYTHYIYLHESGEMRRGRTKYPSAFLSVSKEDDVTIYHLPHQPGVSDIGNPNHLWGFCVIGTLLLVVLLYVGLRWTRQNAYVKI